MPDGIRLTRIRDNGTVVVRQVRFHVSRTLTGNLVYLVEDEAALLVFDDQGTLIIEHPWPAPGTKYVGSGKKRGPAAKSGVPQLDVRAGRQYLSDKAQFLHLLTQVDVALGVTLTLTEGVVTLRVRVG
jgi:hypothetical protein